MLWGRRDIMGEEGSGKIENGRLRHERQDPLAEAFTHMIAVC